MSIKSDYYIGNTKYIVERFNATETWTRPSWVLTVDMWAIGGGGYGADEYYTGKRLYGLGGLVAIVDVSALGLGATQLFTVGARGEAWDGGYNTGGWSGIYYYGLVASGGYCANPNGSRWDPTGFNGTKWGVTLSNVGWGGHSWAYGTNGVVLIKYLATPNIGRVIAAI